MEKVAEIISTVAIVIVGVFTAITLCRIVWKTLVWAWT